MSYVKGGTSRGPGEEEPMMPHRPRPSPRMSPGCRDVLTVQETSLQGVDVFLISQYLQTAGFPPPHTALTSPLTRETGGGVLTSRRCPGDAAASPRTRPVPRGKEVLPQLGQQFLLRGFVSSQRLDVRFSKRPPTVADVDTASTRGRHPGRMKTFFTW